MQGVFKKYYTLRYISAGCLTQVEKELCTSYIGNDRTLQIEVRPDGRTSSLWVRPDAGPDRTGSSGRTYRRTVTGPITEPRPDPETGPTSDDVLEWFP